MMILGKVTRKIFEYFKINTDGLSVEELPPISSDTLKFLKSIYLRKKFFILGYGRSGTTLLARLINLNPEILCKWQGHFFSPDKGFYDNLASSSLKNWMDRNSNRWINDSRGQSGILRASIDFFLEEHAASQGASIVGDKSPNNDRETIRRISCVFPDASILYMLRDGRDVLISKRIQWFIDMSVLLTAEDRKIKNEMTRDNRLFFSGERSIFTPVWIEEYASEWKESVSASIRYGRELYGENFRIIRYEELLSDPVKEMNTVMIWLGALMSINDLDSLITEEINKNPAVEWHNQAAPDLVKGMKRGVSGAWKDIFTSSDYDIFMNVAGDLLKDLDYES